MLMFTKNQGTKIQIRALQLKSGQFQGFWKKSGYPGQNLKSRAFQGTSGRPGIPGHAERPGGKICDNSDMLRSEKVETNISTKAMKNQTTVDDKKNCSDSVPPAEFLSFGHFQTSLDFGLKLSSNFRILGQNRLILGILGGFAKILGILGF